MAKARNLYLLFRFMVKSTEPLQICMWHLLQRKIISIPTNFVWNRYVYVTKYDYSNGAIS